MELDVLAQCLKELSTENGDLEWKAYQAVLELIEMRKQHADLNKHLEERLLPTIDQAFTHRIKSDSPSLEQDIQDHYLLLGLHRVEVTHLLRCTEIKKPRNGEQNELSYSKSCCKSLEQSQKLSTCKPTSARKDERQQTIGVSGRYSKPV